MSDIDNFWFNDPSVLLKKYTEFIPMKHLNKTRRLNAIVRFALYTMILLRLYNRTGYVYYGLIVLIISTIYMNSQNEKIEKMEDVQNLEDKCYMPTKENPFMNVLVNEYAELPDRPPACDLEYTTKKGEQPVKDAIYDNYYSKIFRNVNDLYDNDTFYRHYTMPNTQIPNDRDKFAKALFSDVMTGTCKNKLNPDRCIIYEDLRTKRTI
jgi:hypothetical protein